MWAGIERFVTPLDHVPLKASFLRVTSCEKTFERLLPLQHFLGITRINHISELDVFDVPVVSVTRPNVNAFQLSAAQGKGKTLLDATVSGLMEAVERHGGESYPIDRTSSIKEMGCAFVHPKAFGLECPEETILDWIKGVSLKGGQEIFIPASKVICPYIPTKTAVEISNSTSNGLASGNTILEAVLHGLFEVIERAAIYEFLNGRVPKYLDLKTLDEVGSALVQSIERTGSRVCILDLSEFSLLPTVFVSLLSSHPMFPSVMVAGQGCHVNFSNAITRGLTEVIQSHAVALQGSREDLIRHHSHWDVPEEDLLSTWEEANENAKREGISTFGINSIPDRSIVDSIKDVVLLLEKTGYGDVIVVDLTHPLVQIPVVAVVVPGLPNSSE